jgi:hypothetical protein
MGSRIHTAVRDERQVLGAPAGVFERGGRDTAFRSAIALLTQFLEAVAYAN